MPFRGHRQWSHPPRGAWIEILFRTLQNRILSSHPPRGAWIEIWSNPEFLLGGDSRTPHGVRGLKSLRGITIYNNEAKSHPPRGAWIEIDLYACVYNAGTRRTPHGVRGLKFMPGLRTTQTITSHPPRGAWIEIWHHRRLWHPQPSHPPRGAWIEIRRRLRWPSVRRRRTPHGVRGLKSHKASVVLIGQVSHPPRGAWIEIPRWRSRWR